MCGSSSVAQQISEKDKSKVLSIDEVIDWALAGPSNIKDEEQIELLDELRNQKTLKDEEWEDLGNATPNYDFNQETITRFLDWRSQLSDCKSGIVMDGLSSKYCSIAVAAEAVFSSLRDEKWTICKRSSFISTDPKMVRCTKYETFSSHTQKDTGTGTFQMLYDQCVLPLLCVNQMPDSIVSAHMIGVRAYQCMHMNVWHICKIHGWVGDLFVAELFCGEVFVGDLLADPLYVRPLFGVGSQGPICYREDAEGNVPCPHCATVFAYVSC